jgi:prenyltransferase beta subunit
MPDGGFRGRGTRSDLFYTAFAADLLEALGGDPRPRRTRAYLGGFGAGGGLDLVHLSCLSRCRSRLPPSADFPAARRRAVRRRIEAWRGADGGFGACPGARRGTIAGAVLAMSALEDLGYGLAQPGRLLRSVRSLKSSDGGYANEPRMDTGTTTAAAGAALVFARLGAAADPALAGWLMARAAPGGGFFASPDAPVPDLLSTASALYALRTVGADVSEARDGALRFVGSLRRKGGGYAGHRFDETADCEYSFYALLALGCVEG